MDKAFLEQMKKKVEKELAQKEIEVVQFWKDEVEKISRHKTESLSAMQQELQKLTARMNNRLDIIKRSGI